MYSAFNRSLPLISIFHHPSSPPSRSALALLRSSLSSPYPTNKISAPPLEFNLEVLESTPPTADQLTTILSYLPSANSSVPPLSTFLSSHPASPQLSEHPHTASGIVQLAAKNPNAFKWPVVVDWMGGRASVGDLEGVKGILEAIRQQRDGETKGNV